MNWGFKPSIITNILTEGGYGWGGIEKDSMITLNFQFIDYFGSGLNLKINDNYDSPQGIWYQIVVYLTLTGEKPTYLRDDDFMLVLDFIFISQVMIENWVANNLYLNRINRKDIDYLYNMHRINSYNEIHSTKSKLLKRLVFDNMDKVLIKSRGDLPTRD
jgi:hypothetical protein